MQVTIIGGGSYQWSPKLITDLLGTPSLAGMHLVLEDIDPAPLQKMEAIARIADDKLGSKVTVSSTTDQRRALDGADFVVVTISTGGFKSMAVDIDVPARHGIQQSVGDSVGPGGINRALRNIPVLAGIGHDMEDQCPDAWLLNITNPMTTLTRTVCRETRVKTVGLCHEVGGFCMDLAIAFQKPHTAVRPVIEGVNHFPVICEVDVDGADGFELLAEMVQELGGLDALGALAGATRGGAVLEARLRPAPPAQADPPRPLGGAARGQRPAPRRVHAGSAHRGVGLGGGLGHRADPDITPGRAPGRLHRRGRRGPRRQGGARHLGLG